LGGTIKIARLVALAPEVNLENLEQVISSHGLKAKKQKFKFGFSLFGEINKREIEKIGLAIKRNLGARRINSRLVVSKDKSLSSVIVRKEKLIGQGLDLVIIKTPEGYLLGLTESVQDFNEFSKRDYGRPARDDKSGMLPPKLARMMINLSSTRTDQTILDPFCGSGTVIQEALFLGYKNIIASDISQKAAEFTQNNIDWLQTKYQLETSGVKVYQLDAVDLLDLLEPSSIDAIITEPYLGPPEKLQVNQAKKIINELSELYLKSFKAFYQVLKPTGRVVMIFPIIGSQHLGILDKLRALGFSVEPLSDEPRGSIVYSRPNQRILREIFVFEKK